MAIAVRPAVADDWRAIVEFNLRLAFESEGKQLNRDTVTRGVRTLLDEPHRGRYFVAEIDRQVVGQLMHTFEWSDWRNGEIWWLQSVYVDGDHRRQGVFRALFEFLRAAARTTPGVVGLRLYVEEHNIAAQQTYRALGMQPAGYTVFEDMLPCEP
jgi:GNAT superfamily N-acetyltransferase